ncbi:hypothetical protein F1880_000698 [Penicillium rolfsii]|nr:hypothetical protein F1880_000698 [Penicillium rolfsii]
MEWVLACAPHYGGYQRQVHVLDIAFMMNNHQNESGPGITFGYAPTAVTVSKLLDRPDDTTE